MAKQNATPKPGGKRMGKSTALMIFCGIIAFIVAALPSVIIILVGMIPTVVAYIIDLTPGRYAARCVAGLNIAGVVPFLNRLWTSTNDLPAAIGIVTDVYAWLAFYAASGVGWLLFVSLPGIVASFKTYSAKRSANALRGRLEELKEEWGDEISGNTPEGPRENDDTTDAEVSETNTVPA
tara:strand:+ start:457 stop:996 length:540 start_codon:yes stop_codon:yes gene_type:complete